MVNFTGTAGDDFYDFPGLNGVDGVGDTVDGLGGQDTLDASGLSNNYLFDLDNGIISLTNGGSAGSLLNFEEVIGGNGNDILIGGTDFVLYNLNGGAGDDTVSPGTFGIATGDVFAGGSGTDVLDFSHLNTDFSIDMNLGSFSSNGFNATISSFEEIFAGSGDDFIRELTGISTTLHGGLGDDTLAVAPTGHSGAEVFDGGVGTDRFDFSQVSGLSYDVNLATGQLLAGGGFTGVTLMNIEQVNANEQDNILTAGTNLSATYTLFGNAGEDTIVGRGGDDVLFGGADNDTIFGNLGEDTLYGNAGIDTMNSGAGDDMLFGGDGNDELLGRDGNDVLNGGSGDDLMFGGNQNDTLNGAIGEDTLLGGAGDDRINAGDYNDRLFGSFGNDTLDGGDNDDFVNGGVGDDVLFGGDGEDNLLGRDGNDFLFGGDDNDSLFGGNQNDTVEGANGDDMVQGNGGNDVVRGDNGNDRLFGNFGNDTLEGGSGDDTVDGGTSDDMMSGNTGNDRLIAGNGDDTLIGGADDDALFGQVGNDVLQGNSGVDRLLGGAGNDTMTGGSGNDSFVFAGTFGVDVITDFDTSGDRVNLQSILSIVDFVDLTSNHLSQSSGNAVISVGSNTITLNGVSIAQLDAGDFIF